VVTKPFVVPKSVTPVKNTPNMPPIPKTAPVATNVNPPPAPKVKNPIVAPKVQPKVTPAASLDAELEALLAEFELESPVATPVETPSTNRPPARAKPAFSPQEAEFIAAVKANDYKRVTAAVAARASIRTCDEVVLFLSSKIREKKFVNTNVGW
jgi:type IV secretory pathway VirB10-like protein